MILEPMNNHLASRAVSFGVGLLLTGGLPLIAALGDDGEDRARVCAPGYAESIRPAPDVTRKIKIKMLASLGIGPEGAAFYALDLIVPLELDGDPEDYSNLQLQSWENVGHKIIYQEEPLHAAVCAKKKPIPLSVAQEAIKDAYTLYVPGTEIEWITPRISWDLDTTLPPPP